MWGPGSALTGAVSLSFNLFASLCALFCASGIMEQRSFDDQAGGGPKGDNECESIWQIPGPGLRRQGREGHDKKAATVRVLTSCLSVIVAGVKSAHI